MKVLKLIVPAFLLLLLFSCNAPAAAQSKTAADLLTVLKEGVSARDKTGIIVSHDLGLAVRFADEVLPIVATTDAKGRKMGTLRSEDRLYRTADGGFRDGTGQVIRDAVTHLSKFLEPAA